MTDALSQTVARIAECRLCASRFLDTATGHAPRPVLRVSTRARVLIAGQAPGARVHASGLPFDDPSGDRLRQWLGVDRAAVVDPARGEEGDGIVADPPDPSAMMPAEGER